MINEIELEELINSYEMNKIKKEFSIFINENKQDFIDDMILEQVRRDQWNRQFGFLLSELGYEVVPEEDVQKMLNEGFGMDLAIDAFFALAPTVARGLGALATPTGAGPVVAEAIAKMLAGGGAAYYAYYAYKEYEEGNKLNTFFNILNMLFSLEQAAIPFVSDAIAAAGKLFIKFLGGFFKGLIKPFSMLKDVSAKAAGTGLKAVGEKIGMDSLKEIGQFLAKNEVMLSKGSKALTEVVKGGAAAAQKLEGILGPILKNETFKAANPAVVTKLEIMLSEINGTIMKEAVDSAEVLGKAINSASTASKATDIVAKNKAVLEAVKELNVLSKSGGILENYLPTLTKDGLIALEKEIIGAGGEALGKVGAEVVEKQMAKGIVALEATLSKGATDVAADMTSSLASKLTSLPLGGLTSGSSSFIAPEITIVSDKLILKYPGLMGSLSGTEVAFAEGMQSIMKEIAEKQGPEIANTYYKAVMEGISSGPVYKEMVEAFGNLAVEGAQSSTVREWVSKNLWKVIVEDSGGLIRSFDKFKTEFIRASTRSGATGVGAVNIGIEAVLKSFGRDLKVLQPVTLNFWKTVSQLVSGSMTAGRKFTDERTASDIYKAKIEKQKAQNITPSTIKTRKDGTAGKPKAPKQATKAGATKTNKPNFGSVI